MSLQARTVPGPPFVGAAVLGMVIQFSQPLVELGTDCTPLQVWHRQFVLRLHKRLRRDKKLREISGVHAPSDRNHNAPLFLHRRGPQAMRMNHRFLFRDNHPPDERCACNRETNKQILSVKLDFLERSYH